MKHIIFLTTLLFLLIGCSSKEKIVYKDVYIPVQCKVPKVECVISKDITAVEVIREMLECIEDYKISIRVCE